MSSLTRSEDVGSCSYHSQTEQTQLGRIAKRVPKAFSRHGDQNFGVLDRIEQPKGSLDSSRGSGVACEERSAKSSKTDVLFD